MPITKVSQDLIYSWWGHIISSVEPSSGEIIFAGVKDDGDPRIFRRDTGEDYATPPQNHILYTPAPEADDHNSVSHLAREGKDLIVFWQRHGQSDQLNYWKAPEGTFNFGSKQVIYFPGMVTYCELLDYEDTIYALCRIDADHWYFVKSTDWGDTWGEPVHFFDGSAEGGQMYCLAVPKEDDPTIVQLCFYGHPTSSPWRDVVYGEIDLATGDIDKFSGNVANMDGANLPLIETSLDVAFTPDPLVAGQRVRLLDVAKKQGKNVIALARWNNVTTQAQYYFYIQDPTAGTWSTVSLISSGGTFNDGGGRKYVGGMAFDRSGLNKVYISYKDPTWRIKKYQFDANFALGTNITLQSNADYPLVRPYAIRGQEACLWQELRTYTDFTNYLSHMWLYEF